MQLHSCSTSSTEPSHQKPVFIYVHPPSPYPKERVVYVNRWSMSSWDWFWIATMITSVVGSIAKAVAANKVTGQ